MGKKTGHEPTRGVKKAIRKAVLPAVITKEAKLPQGPSGFLKDRLGKKVRELRLGSGGAAGAAGGDIDSIHFDAECRGTNFAAQGGLDAAGDLAETPDTEAGTNLGREAENTRRRFYSELRKVLAAADVIIEVLDARDPGSCRCTELEREVTTSGKKLVLLINKIDLVPKEAVAAWVKHLQRSFPVIAFKAAQGVAQRPKHAMTSAGKAPEGLLRSTHAVVGADELMQLLKNYARTGGGRMKSHVTVGFVGYPNTGKSSVINSMKRHAAVEVGGRAGVTKVMQEVQLDAKVTLIDSPGVVFAGKTDDPAVALRNVVRVEGIADPVGVVEALVMKAPREAILKFYGMPRDFAAVSEFLIHVAKQRGKLQRGRGLDLPSAARSVISDWTTGKFRYYVLPPASSLAAAAAAEAETAEVVTMLAPAFDVDALFSGEGSAPTILGAPSTMGREDGDVDMDDTAGKGMVEVDMGSLPN